MRSLPNYKLKVVLNESCDAAIHIKNKKINTKYREDNT